MTYGDIENYKVIIFKQTENNFNEVDRRTTSETTVGIFNLSAHTKYAVQVKACNEKGCGVSEPSTKSLIVTTAQAGM